MYFLRGAIAVLLLVAFGACHALPVTVAPRAGSKNCCTSHACCHKKSFGNEKSARNASAGGSFFAAGADCRATCRLPASLAVHTSPPLAPRVATADTAAISETLRGRPVVCSYPTSYCAFLYQRPPPAQF
jgi:hypothetical protein